MQGLDSPLFGDVFPVKITSPTCEDLGIPKEGEDIFMPARLIRNPSLHLDGLRYEAVIKRSLSTSDPFSPMCLIPLPSPFTLEHLEPTFIRKRNERERERVRCVNDGYAKLKDHLPLEKKHKRISKVETLRKAIEYIRYLNSLLENDVGVESMSKIATNESCNSTTTIVSCDTKEPITAPVPNRTVKPNDSSIKSPDDNIRIKLEEDQQFSQCCTNSIDDDAEKNIFSFENVSDSENDFYGSHSDLGYDSFASSCELEDENISSCEFQISDFNDTNMKRKHESYDSELDDLIYSPKRQCTSNFES